MVSFVSFYLFFYIVSECGYNTELFKGETEYRNIEPSAVVLQQFTVSSLGLP